MFVAVVPCAILYFTIKPRFYLNVNVCSLVPSPVSAPVLPVCSELPGCGFSGWIFGRVGGERRQHGRTKVK